MFDRLNSLIDVSRRADYTVTTSFFLESAKRILLGDIDEDLFQCKLDIDVNYEQMKLAKDPAVIEWEQRKQAQESKKVQDEEKLYSPKDFCYEHGLTPQKVGGIAKKLGLKNRSEYSRWVQDKGELVCKYTQKGICEILKSANKEIS